MNISTHTPLTGRDGFYQGLQEWLEISTHTPLTGRDISIDETTGALNNFYSHAPYGT